LLKIQPGSKGRARLKRADDGQSKNRRVEAENVLTRRLETGSSSSHLLPELNLKVVFDAVSCEEKASFGTATGLSFTPSGKGSPWFARFISHLVCTNHDQSDDAIDHKAFI
jgi:hypothetical protein